MEIEPNEPLALVDWGVGGGEVPSLLRSFRVTIGRDCESNDVSVMIDRRLS